MKVVRTALVALGLLVLGTRTSQAEPGGAEPPATVTASPAPAAEPTPSVPVPPPTVAELSAERLRHAIELAAGFLGPQQMRGDDVWIATQGASLLGPGFKAWARTLQVPPAVVNAAKQSALKAFPLLLPTEARLWSLRGLQQRKLTALPKPNDAPVAGVEPRRFDEQSPGDIILLTVLSATCPDLTPKLRAAWLKLLSPPKSSYVLTSQLFGVMLGYNQGCLSPSVANPLRRELAAMLLRQVRADMATLDDLAIVRLAALSYAGVGGWIDPQLIARLVAEQKPSGSWGWRDPRIPGLAVATENHTATNAFYTLARAWSLRYASSHTPAPKAPGENHEGPKVRKHEKG